MMLVWLPLGGSASLALDSIDVKCAGNSGVWSTVAGMLVGVDRYCEVAVIGRLCMLPWTDGVTKLKLEDACSDGAVAVEKLVGN